MVGGIETRTLEEETGARADQAVHLLPAVRAPHARRGHDALAGLEPLRTRTALVFVGGHSLVLPSLTPQTSPPAASPNLAPFPKEAPSQDGFIVGTQHALRTCKARSTPPSGWPDQVSVLSTRGVGWNVAMTSHWRHKRETHEISERLRSVGWGCRCAPPPESNAPLHGLVNSRNIHVVVARRGRAALAERRGIPRTSDTLHGKCRRAGRPLPTLATPRPRPGITSRHPTWCPGSGCLADPDPGTTGVGRASGPRAPGHPGRRRPDPRSRRVSAGSRRGPGR